MVTIEGLRAYGAKVDEGIARCMNNEGFYLRVVNMALADGNFDRLKAALEAGDSPAAFEAAHALKGATGNVALTPIYEPVCRLTELLRGRTEPVDAGDLLDEIMDQLARARSL
jgi:hypothetical protein